MNASIDKKYLKELVPVLNQAVGIRELDGLVCRYSVILCIP